MIFDEREKTSGIERFETKNSSTKQFFPIYLFLLIKYTLNVMILQDNFRNNYTFNAVIRQYDFQSKKIRKTQERIFYDLAFDKIVIVDKFDRKTYN